MQISEVQDALDGVTPTVVTGKLHKKHRSEQNEFALRAREFAHILEAEKCDPAIIAARFAMGNVACHQCQGKKKLRYRRTRDGKLVFDPDPKAPRTRGLLACLHCKGTGKEPLVPQIVLNAAIALLPYRWPRLKRMEHFKANLNLTGSMTVVELAEMLSRIPQEGGAPATFAPTHLPPGDEPAEIPFVEGDQT